MKKIIVATNNKHKLVELKDMLGNICELISLGDLNEKTEPKEDGLTFSENAYKKAKYYYDIYKLPVIADDTGLVVPALNGMPGIYSARYASLGQEEEFHDDYLNRKKLIKELENKTDRGAYFECTICYIDNDTIQYFTGKTYGHIIKTSEEETQSNGFGYDKLFYSDALNKTFGEATEAEKNSVSHRGRAVNKLKEYILNDRK